MLLPPLVRPCHPFPSLRRSRPQHARHPCFLSSASIASRTRPSLSSHISPARTAIATPTLLHSLVPVPSPASSSNASSSSSPSLSSARVGLFAPVFLHTSFHRVCAFAPLLPTSVPVLISPPPTPRRGPVLYARALLSSNPPPHCFPHDRVCPRVPCLPLAVRPGAANLTSLTKLETANWPEASTAVRTPALKSAR